MQACCRSSEASTQRKDSQAIQALYENISSAFLLNNQLGKVLQNHSRCPSGVLNLFNLFLEKTMQETLHDCHTSISIGGRPMCNLGFADDIDLIGGSSGELRDFINRLVDKATTYGMEVSREKS